MMYDLEEYLIPMLCLLLIVFVVIGLYVGTAKNTEFSQKCGNVGGVSVDAGDTLLCLHPSAIIEVQ